MKSDLRSNNRSNASPGLLKVARKNLGERNRVALFQRFQQFDMLSRCTIPVRLVLVADEPDTLKARLDRRMRRGQAIIAGQRGNSGMDRLVELVILKPFAVRVQAHHPVVQGANLGYLLVRGIEAGETSGKGLERDQHIEHVADVSRTELMDDPTSPGNKVDQSLAGEEFQRLSQRRPGHAKRLAKLAFVNPRSGFQDAFDDHIADALDKIVVQRMPHHWKDRVLVHSGL
jgi:hypothetical protein